MDDLSEWIAGLLRDMADALEAAATTGNVPDQLALLAPIVTVLTLGAAGLRWLMTYFRRDKEKLRERIRDVEAEMADVRARNDALRCYDPEGFLDRFLPLEKAADRDAVRDAAREYLTPLRPALGALYAALAREQLLGAADVEDLRDARYHAWGAAGADATPEALALVNAVEEARDRAAFEAMPEAEALDWQLIRTSQDVAALLRTGRMYQERGKYHLALTLFERARANAAREEGPWSHKALEALHYVAQAQSYLGRYATAQAMFEECRDGLVDRRGLPEDDPLILSASFGVARQLRYRGHYAEAETTLRTLLAVEERHDVLGPEHPHTLVTRAEIARLLSHQGRYAEAEAAFRAVLAVRESPDNLGPEHPQTLITRGEIAQQLSAQGRYAEAEEALRAVLEVAERSDILGSEHPQTLATRAEIAQQLSLQGDYTAAEKLFREVVAVEERTDVLGREHPETMATRRELAWTRVKGGKWAEGLAELQEVMDVQCAHPSLGPDHPGLVRTRLYLAGALIAGGQIDKARGLVEDSRVRLRGTVADGHRHLLILNEIEARTRAGVAGADVDGSGRDG